MSLVTVEVQGNFEQLKRAAAQIAAAKARMVKVGILAGATYPSGMTVSQVAQILELGWTQSVTPRQSGWFTAQGFGSIRPGVALHLPPRPTFHFVFRSKSARWQKLGENILKRVLTSPNPAAVIRRALEMMGLAAQQDLMQEIANHGAGYGAAPRSPLTLALYLTQAMAGNHRVAGTNNTTATEPLIRSGLLMRSIAYEIT